MQPTPEPRIATGAAIRDGFATLLRAPFRGLLLLAMLISLTSTALPTEGDAGTLFAALVLVALALYIQISVTLAAAEGDPAPSVDHWVREAWGRRCFWRYFATAILVVLMVFGGLIALIVGGFLVGGMVALADPAVVLERKRPVEAVVRSFELGKPARVPLIVIFGLLVLIPTMGIQVASFFWDLPDLFGNWWHAVSIVVVVMGLAAAVALTRAFLVLGGSKVLMEKRAERVGT